ncbi:calmodulin-binding receptor-like cytoplasmic kinase 3 [Macadamia integrifolia]|uniref:calmodulin-binding receptor-like cytoplasmic kinase 3 n=1 Tax=Macadamia integrifolia TaxID=60698 RepID=UPI001C500CDD|nr:calmodulin-binding receptor-like cytoplasmic kinase 3 [Macadamia integrifolia]XP_042482741.1 calmodulin-binding receptor-like cytoplasmic kinase 3 [Macadamia integrifolia]XP_042482742.1 calmodulin-binding receptor-like cytoplasmic kinase 3 [Macadamia integrifolia]
MMYGCFGPLRLFTVILSILVLVQFPGIYVSGIEVWSKVCGADEFTYTRSLDDELFYINGNKVDKVSFCKPFEFYYRNGCFLDLGLEEWGRLGRNYCSLEIYSVQWPQMGGRRSLRGTDQSTLRILSQRSHQIEKNHVPSSWVAPKNITMVASGFLLLYCSFLCGRSRSKSKESTDAVTVKEPNSIDSGSSIAFSSAPASSPLRVPPSPRIGMHPPLDRIGSVHLNMSQVVRATQNFSSAMKIGEGGFGAVYKAELQDGQVVAVKRAKKEHFGNLQTEFSSEVELLAKIEHRNLVRLLGYVDKGNERIIITEYVPNGSLREHLDGKRGKILDFNQRLEISIDVAHALTYLHQYAEKQIIHRDVKSSNILLTESYRAKVADFGFARLGPMETDQTHISTKVKGTAGYLDPEYLRTYQLTPKSDVFSFGILLVEILTGRRPVEMKRPADERVTVRWAFTKYNEGNVVELADPLMSEMVPVEILMKMFSLAFQCAAPTRSDRPGMKEAGEQLWGIRVEYLKCVKRV